jgi:hypothetical protein
MHVSINLCLSLQSINEMCAIFRHITWVMKLFFPHACTYAHTQLFRTKELKINYYMPILNFVPIFLSLINTLINHTKSTPYNWKVGSLSCKYQVVINTQNNYLFTWTAYLALASTKAFSSGLEA